MGGAQRPKDVCPACLTHAAWVTVPHDMRPGSTPFGQRAVCQSCGAVVAKSARLQYAPGDERPDVEAKRRARRHEYERENRERLNGVRRKERAAKSAARTARAGLPPRQHQRWTASDLAALHERPGESATSIAARIQRTPEGVRQMRLRLGLTKGRGSRWEPWEIEMAGTADPREVARATGRTVEACRRKRRRMGLRAGRREWEPWELELVDGGASPAYIAKKTGRTLGSVYEARKRRRAPRIAAPAWEPWEDGLLRDGKPGREVARATGRTVEAVRTRKRCLKKRGLL